MEEKWRQELKYTLTKGESILTAKRLAPFMQRDRHTEGGKEYLIRSLYFDTLGDRDYFDKEEGLEIRRKIRLRCYQVLLQRSEEFAAECYGIMNCRLYRPKGIVEYNRLAFIGKENDTRITFDSNIRGTESNYNIFEKNLCLYPVFESSWVIMEVKYNGFLLSYIKSLLDSVGCREISVGKYSCGRGITYTKGM